MSIFKIASWNVNSLRVRLPHVLTWLSSVSPTVLALQETKLVDADFPVSALQEAGYHTFFSGQKTYNGMAVLVKNEIESRLIKDIVTDIPGLHDPQRRILGLTVGEIRIFNLYVPNGESTVSEKYQYKLNWLSHLTDFIKNEQQQYNNLILLGDFNIAPEPIDVHDPSQWEGKVLFSQPERLAFQGILNNGFQDCFRLHSQGESHYSWWDYRLNAFKRNLGLRIDHILASTNLAKYCQNCQIDVGPRGWERPSDHAPVIAELSFS